MFCHLPIIDEKTSEQLGKASSKGTSIVIVTYNSASTLEHCLHTVLTTSGELDEVIVVDNASSDNTVEIARGFLAQTSRLRVIASEINTGFSVGCNIGLRESKGEFLVLLNPDTSVSPRWLEKMQRAFIDDSIGAVGPLSDAAAGDQYIGRYLPEGYPVFELQDRLTERFTGRYLETKLLFGFCTMFRRDTLNAVGLLDEDLFLGNDDLEMSWRLRSHGLKLLVAKDVFIHHENHVSFNTVEDNIVHRLIEESSQALNTKLEKHFGYLPEATELWGL